MTDRSTADLRVADLDYTALPVPAFPEHTVRIPAGSVTFGVEYRHLDEDMIMAFYGPESRAKFGNERPAGMAAVVEEDGLSVHVFETATGHEVLRFDCFDDAPHYHLLDVPRSANRVYNHDAATDGRLLDWALASMRTDLRALVAAAGADEAAAALDDGEVAAALDLVDQVARYVEAAGRPVPLAQP
jgi:hypothetical protein